MHVLRLDAVLSVALAPRRTARSYKIVYVEDNPSNVAFMVALLGAFERIELLTAPTAEIGIELVRNHRPAVVIMDINLFSSARASQRTESRFLDPMRRRSRSVMQVPG